VADGEPHILADNVVAEHVARRTIGFFHTATGDHQHRLDDRLEHRAEPGRRGTRGFGLCRDGRTGIDAQRHQTGDDPADQRDQRAGYVARQNEHGDRRDKSGEHAEQKAGTEAVRHDPSVPRAWAGHRQCPRSPLRGNHFITLPAAR